MLIIGAGQRTSRNQVGTASAPGTCGELVQGFTSSGQPFHVTCPIEKTSTVSVTLKPAQEFSVHQMSGQLDKLELGLLRTAEYLDLEPCEMRVARWTDLEIGKGMGSSTADIVAGARALGAAVNRKLSASRLAAIATSVESSDGSMYPGIVAFDQKNGALLRHYVWWPQFLIVIVIPPKVFNTESADFAGKLRFGQEFDEILDCLDKASQSRSAHGFAEAATHSAALNQDFVPSAHHALLEDRLNQLGALGIAVGHTGTIVGLLFDATDKDSRRAAAAASIEVQGMFPDARVEMTLTPRSPDD